MRAIMESSFDIIYLISVISIGIYLISVISIGIYLVKCNRKTFGFMAILLGVGDAFHLVPRIMALNAENGFEIYTQQLGFGKLITSITMTVFYIILYYIYKERYDVENKQLDITMWILGIIRVILCLMPQNEWFIKKQPLNWAIYRNIPFAIMGLILIILFYKNTKRNNDVVFKNMALAITLSFGFYIPVVLWGDRNSVIGLLMIPKTLAYVWIVLMGYKDYKLTKNIK